MYSSKLETFTSDRSLRLSKYGIDLHKTNENRDVYYLYYNFKYRLD